MKTFTEEIYQETRKKKISTEDNCWKTGATGRKSRRKQFGKVGKNMDKTCITYQTYVKENTSLNHLSIHLLLDSFIAFYRYCNLVSYYSLDD